MSNNLDRKTVESFGDEWLRFDQSGMPENVKRIKGLMSISQYFPEASISP